jgi:hypothetical protein
MALFGSSQTGAFANEFCRYFFLVALMKTNKEERGHPNRTNLVRVICIFVLFLAFDLEIGLQGR